MIVVAVGVVTDDKGRILVTRRAADAHQGGLWEFPGGKVESGEGVLEALARELKEELGLTVEASEPLIRIEHDYGDKQVALDVHRVTQWRNEPRGLEGQPLAWLLPEALKALEFPEANTAILECLLMP